MRKTKRIVTIGVLLVLALTLLPGVSAAQAAPDPHSSIGWREGGDCTGAVVIINPAQNTDANGLRHVGRDCGEWRWNGTKWVLTRRDVSASREGGFPGFQNDVVVPNLNGEPPTWTPGSVDDPNLPISSATNPDAVPANGASGVTPHAAAVAAGATNASAFTPAGGNVSNANQGASSVTPHALALSGDGSVTTPSALCTGSAKDCAPGHNKP